jgi:hypothetical protein
LNLIIQKCVKLFADHPSQFASFESVGKTLPAGIPGGHFFLPSEEDTPMTQPAPEPSTHAAVNRCITAYRQAVQAGAGTSSSAAREAGINAYCAALPIISTRESIREFIACITQGMVFRVFWKDEGPKLIAAAKAALATFYRDREPAPPGPNAARGSGRPAESDQKSAKDTVHETDRQ